MGNNQTRVRGEEQLRSIRREVKSIITSVKLSRKNISQVNKEIIVENLVKCSSKVSALYGRVNRKEIQSTLKDISETMEEVLRIETNQVDSGSVETDSFVSVPLSQSRSASLSTLRSIKKSNTKSMASSRSTPSLRDIEGQVEQLKCKIPTAISNRDIVQLKDHQKTIVFLTAELDMIPLSEADSLTIKRKGNLNKKLDELYRKSTRAMKEQKQIDNIKNSSKTHMPRADLAQIELAIAQNDSLMDALIQQKDADLLQVRNNMMEINKNLATVIIADKEVKERVGLLSQKLSKTARNLDQVMARREFDSKLGKLLEWYERLMRNFDPNSNSDSTLNNLEVLRSSLESLEETDDKTKNSKKDLLNRICCSIDKITQTLEQYADGNIVKGIVEDNVILRRNLKSSDKEFTVIDQFINYWTNVKENFNVNAYSNLSLLRIESVLEDMQASINDLRIEIAKKCNTNPPTNLSKKRSQSVPKLHTKDNSNETDLIKTSAKIYNIPKHEVRNNEQQTHSLKFSQVENIKLHVHKIKLDMNNNSNKIILKNKLEECQNLLAEYVNDSNQTVANNANLVLEEINEIATKIVLETFKEKLPSLSHRTQKLKGTKNFEWVQTLKTELFQIKLDLKNLNIPSKYESLLQEKEYLLNEFRANIDILNQNDSLLKKQESERAEQLKQTLQELKAKVHKFSGICGGVQYNQIERGLNKLLLNIGELSNKTLSITLTQEIEKLSKILEDRASQPQSLKKNTDYDPKEGEHIETLKIKNDLLQLKLDIDQAAPGSNDDFLGFQSRLELIKFELGQIVVTSNENLAKKKEIYMSETEALMKVINMQISLGNEPFKLKPPKLCEYAANKEMEKIEQVFENIKEKISNSTSEQARHDFYQFANDIRNQKKMLERYDVEPESELYQKQANMIKEMETYIDILENEAADLNFIFNMEKRIKELEEEFANDPQSRLLELEGELQSIRSGIYQYNMSSSNETLSANKLKLEHQTDLLIQKLEDLKQHHAQLKDDKKEKAAIENVKQNIKLIAPQIHSFIGVKSSNEYYKLNETIIRSSLALDEILINKGELHNSRIKLLKELHTLGNLLDERTKQTEQIFEIERALNEISDVIKQNVGKDFKMNIVERLEEIGKRLANLQLVVDLVPRQEACAKRVIMLEQQLEKSSEYTNYSSSEYLSKTYSLSSSKISINSGNNEYENDDILTAISTRIEAIAKDIEDTKSDNDLQQLDNDLIELTVQIKNIYYPAHMNKQPTLNNLKHRINFLTEIIENKMQDNDRFNIIKQEVDLLRKKISKPSSSEVMDQIDDQLNQILLDLKKISNPSLKADIDQYIDFIIRLTKHIANAKNVK